MIGFNSNLHHHQNNKATTLKISPSFFDQMHEMTLPRDRSVSDVPRFNSQISLLSPNTFNPRFSTPLGTTVDPDLNKRQSPFRAWNTGKNLTQMRRPLLECYSEHGSLPGALNPRVEPESVIRFRKMEARAGANDTDSMEADALSFDGDCQAQGVFGQSAIKGINFGVGSFCEIKSPRSPKGYASTRFCDSPATRRAMTARASPFAPEFKGLTASPFASRSLLTLTSPLAKRCTGPESMFFDRNFVSSAISTAPPSQNIFLNDFESESVHAPFSSNIKSAIEKNCFYESEEEVVDSKTLCQNKLAGFSSLFSSRSARGIPQRDSGLYPVRSCPEQSVSLSVRRMQLMMKAPLSKRTSRGLLVSRSNSVFEMGSGFGIKSIRKSRAQRSLSEVGLGSRKKSQISSNLLTADLNLGAKPGALFKKFCLKRGLLRSKNLLKSVKFRCDQSSDPPAEVSFFSSKQAISQQQSPLSQSFSVYKSSDQGSPFKPEPKPVCIKHRFSARQIPCNIGPRAIKDSQKSEPNSDSDLIGLHSGIASKLLLENEFDRHSALNFVKKFKDFVESQRGVGAIRGSRAGLKRVKPC